ncbi:MAG: TolC family protein [Salinivirgaceae bacterium]|jgi:outer membrane protein|nr:TolC family protein [Salinivirgaceae bacterium]
MKRKPMIIGAAMLLIVTNFYGQEPVELSVKEATELALEKNKELQNARKDVNIAEEQYKETRGQGLPQVSGTFDYMTNFNYEAELDFGGGDTDPVVPDIDPTQFDAGDMEILKLLESMSAGSSGGSTIVLEDQANAKVQVSQLIFGGQYWVGLKTAKIARELASQNVEITALDVKERVVSSYQLILVTEEIVTILSKNIENLEAMKAHTQNMVQAGVKEQTDADQLSVSISQLENQKKSMERNVNLNYNMLRYQMGLPNEQEIVLAESFDDVIKEMNASNALSEALELEQNPNYRIVETQEGLQKKLVDMEKWAFAPTLTGFYSYTEKIMTSGFDLSPKNAAGLTLNVPIFSGGTRKSKLEQARLELDKVARNREMLEEQLKIQDNQLKFDLASALENYTTQKENVEVAKRILKTTENKYKQGIVSSLELTQVNSKYMEAHSTFLSAAMELIQANIQLKKLHNNL